MPSTRPEKERAFRKGPGGRPTSLTPAVVQKICAYLQDGNYLETAAAAAGVSKKVLHDWLRRAASDDKDGRIDTPHQEFRAAVEVAMAEAEAKDLKRLSKAANKGSVHAITWRLERRNPKRWGAAKRLMEEDEDEQGGAFRFSYSLDDDGDDDGTGDD